jgi:apolipoprotein N-acyltransferase
MKRLHLILLSALTGILLSLGWPADGFPLLLFFAFIPLLLVENHFFEKQEHTGIRIAPYAIISFFIWNVLTTYWIKNSTYLGAALAIIFNTVFMATIFTAFHVTHKRAIRKEWGYLVLVLYWISFEHVHHHWDLNWPWLNLGNGFGNYTKWVQWYEFTGMLGGSIWVLTVNILLFLGIKQWLKDKKFNRNNLTYFGSGAAILIVPIIISLLIYSNYKEKNNPVDVTVIQPNVDPYAEQYTLPPKVIVTKILGLCAGKVDRKTDYIVTPESAIQEYAFENEIDSTESIILLRQYLQQIPQAKMVVGMSTLRAFKPGEVKTPSARKANWGWYDAYNTAMMIDTNQLFQKHHKSKLTPGVEIMPFHEALKFLDNYAIDLGGTVGTLGVDSAQIPFTGRKNLKVAPVICYESAYGEFVSHYVRNGANMIFVITNDGWWGNTPGYRQHFLFSRLRAIETRRSVARSANTGISGFINQRGDVSQATKYWVPAAIRQTINANDVLTFYVKHGDYLARISVIGALLSFLFTIGMIIITKKK